MENESLLESVNAGSSNGVPAEDTNAGETIDVSKIDLSKYVPKEQYQNLEQKLGEQGREVGEWRDLFKDVEPYLTKLDNDPELAEMIANGKIDSKLIKGVLEGQITKQNAATVTEANKEVKKEIGKETYNSISPDEIAAMVEKKARELMEINNADKESIKKDVLSHVEEERALDKFQQKTESFINNTPDFKDYISEIKGWLDSNPGIDSVEVAYYAVKGQKATEAERSKFLDDKKNIAANAGTGGYNNSGNISKEDMLDKLISGSTNPNSFIR